MLKNVGLTPVYNEFNDFLLLEIKDKLDKYFMASDQYKNLHAVYKEIVDYIVKIFSYNSELEKRNIENMNIQKLYDINQLALSNTFRKVPLPIDKFDYYYDSSYRFFTYDGAWDACSRRRDRMERESHEFLSNYSQEIFDYLNQYYIKKLTTYLVNVDKILRRHKGKWKNNKILVKLNDNYFIVLNPDRLVLTQKESDIMKIYLLSLFSNINIPGLSVGFSDYDVKDNGKRLFSKAYKYDIYTDHIQNSLKKLADDIWKQYLIHLEEDEVVTKFIESITSWLKAELF